MTLLQQPIIPQSFITMNPIINSLDQNNVSISKEMLNKVFNKIILYINFLKNKKCQKGIDPDELNNLLDSIYKQLTKMETS
jgi:hypothetical protein